MLQLRHDNLLFFPLCMGLFLVWNGVGAFVPSTADPRVNLLNQAMDAGIKKERLVLSDWSWIITGRTDPRVRVHGVMDTVNDRCNIAPGNWQGNRTGARIACQCDKILYNRDGVPLRRYHGTLDKATGGVIFSPNGTWLNTGINFIEAGVCYPGPCCQLAASGDNAIVAADLEDVYLKLPAKGINTADTLSANFLTITCLPLIFLFVCLLI